MSLVASLTKRIRKKRDHGPSEMMLIDKVARFVACEMIRGDYIEFGVFQGNSFVNAYRSLHQAFRSRVADSGSGNSSADQAKERQQIIDSMRFFAFDSFEGLPELSGVDQDTKDFAKGQYSFDEESFCLKVQEKGVDSSKMITVPGWFDQTCTESTRQKHQLKSASVVWVDGDLYASAVPALNFITPLLQDGTVIIFDDWFAFRGHPQRGEQRAFREWLATLDGYVATEFQKEGVWRNSFIMNRT